MTAGFLSAGALVGGRYEVENEIGRGGSAVVYGARDRQVGTKVALKVLAPAPALAHIVRERTRREILAARALAHPNVVPVFDMIEESPYLVLVMEWVLGSDLDAIVTEKGPRDADELAALGHDLAHALSAAHKRGILHRDVKPRNVLLDGQGRARLTDFGSARVEGQETLTHTGGLVGTLGYAAPEVVAGRRGDARADVYSLGMTLFLAATGRLPPRPSPHLPPTPAEAGHHARDFRPDLPGWLDGIVARATAADPRRRFPTAAGMAEALGARNLAPLPAPPAMPGRVDFCLSCGAPEPLGLMICPRCGDIGPGHGDTWLLVAPPASPAERQALAARLSSLLSLPPDDPAAREAAAGRRVLARLGAALAAQAAAHLQTRGVPVRAVSARRDWGLLPAPMYALAAAAAVVGTVAGLMAHPGFLFTTPPVAGLVLVLGLRGVARPLLVAGRRSERLPADVVAAVARTLGELPAGDARVLLADVVRLARGTFGPGTAGEAGGAGVLEAETTALVLSSCEAAASLGRVEEGLTRASAGADSRVDQTGCARRVPSREVWRGGWGPPPSPPDHDGRLEAARAALVQHLLDAIASLGEALAHASQPAPDVLERLARTSREMREELRIRAEAQAEVAALLGERPRDA